MPPYITIVFSVVLTTFFVWYMIHHMRKLNFVKKLIDTYEHDVENPKLIDEMYEYCAKDRALKKVVEKHNATRDDFNFCYHKLLTWGNFRKYNRFVPISSFFAVYTLNYMLTHTDQDDKDYTMRMMNFFNI